METSCWQGLGRGILGTVLQHRGLVVLLQWECAMQVIQVTLGIVNTWGLKNTVITSGSCLRTTPPCLRCLHAKVLAPSQLFFVSQLLLPIGQGQPCPHGPKSSRKNSAPFYLFPRANSFFFFYSRSFPEEWLMSCKFSNWTLVVAEEMYRNNSTCVPLLQKEELTVAEIHLEPTYGTDSPNHDSPLIPYYNTPWKF